MPRIITLFHSRWSSDANKRHRKLAHVRYKRGEKQTGHLMNRTSRICAAVLLAAGLAAAQEASGNQPEEKESKRILWIIPNYRTSPSLENFKPLTPGQKFKV